MKSPTRTMKLTPRQLASAMGLGSYSQLRPTNKFLSLRRTVSLVLLCVVLSSIYAYDRHQQSVLRNNAYTSGYILAGAIVFLACYSLRKKLSPLALGRATTWFQVHIYVGLGSIFLFCLHVGFRVPQGVFELVLALVFTVVTTSGFFGLYLTRSIPRKLSKLPEEYIYERIPALRHHVAQDAKHLVLTATEASQSNVIADFYHEELAPFFELPRGWRYAAFPGSHRRRQLMSRLSNLQRFCTEPEREAGESLFDLVRQKDNLDYHFAMQSILKTWSFGHVALTYSLIALGLLHAVVVHVFRGYA